VGPSFEVGTPIRITRRVHARNMVIQLCNCVIQYDGNLKTERYGCVQVVLLQSLSNTYQGVSYEGVQKYGGRDVSESSSVSCCSKDGMAGCRATTFTIHRPQNFVIFGLTNLKAIKEKCSSVVGNR
jgi:hypothetical protein